MMRIYHKLPSSLALLSFLVGEASAQGVIWSAPGPITRIESTYIIPAVPVTPINNATQGFWMGMEPANDNAVIQNVVGNRGVGVGEWGFWPEYCCDPNIFLKTSEKVYPGDKLLNRIAQNSSSGEWIMSWWLKPGDAGAAARETPFAGSLVFDPKFYPAKDPFQTAFLVIEVNQTSYWDFGEVAWEDILIEANTTETSWCVAFQADPHAAEWSTTPPNATVIDGMTTCRVEKLTLGGP